jgi:hypothetical protein
MKDPSGGGLMLATIKKKAKLDGKTKSKTGVDPV